MFDSHVWKEHARRDLPQQGALAHVRAAESKRTFQEAHEHRCLDSSSQVHSVHRSSEDDALAWLCLAEVLSMVGEVVEGPQPLRRCLFGGETLQ